MFVLGQAVMFDGPSQSHLVAPPGEFLKDQKGGKSA
jgi:hypothetical protein